MGDKEQKGPEPLREIPPPDAEVPSMSRIGQLQPESLIPEEISSIPGVGTNLKVFVKVTGSIVRYFITDGQSMSLLYLGDDQDQVIGDVFEDFPETRLEEGVYTRPLIRGNFEERSPDVLLGGDFKVNSDLRRRRLGSAFQTNLERVAKELGYRFICGSQPTEEATLFFLAQGRYLLSEIKDEYLSEFKTLENEAEEIQAYDSTIKFLNPEDISEYVKLERINTNVDDKIEYREKIIVLKSLFDKIEGMLKELQESGDLGTIDIDTLVEIMVEMHRNLPPDHQFVFTEPSVEDNGIGLSLMILLAYLKNRSSLLIREISLESLNENLGFLQG